MIDFIWDIVKLLTLALAGLIMYTLKAQGGRIGKVEAALTLKRDKTDCEDMQGTCRDGTADKLENYHQRIAEESLHIKELAAESMKSIGDKLDTIAKVVEENKNFLVEVAGHVNVLDGRQKQVLTHMNIKVID